MQPWGVCYVYVCWGRHMADTGRHGERQRYSDVGRQTADKGILRKHIFVYVQNVIDTNIYIDRKKDIDLKRINMLYIMRAPTAQMCPICRRQETIKARVVLLLPSCLCHCLRNGRHASNPISGTLEPKFSQTFFW